MRDLHPVLSELDTIEPPDLEERLRHRIGAVEHLRPSASRRSVLSFAAAAALAIVVFGGWILLTRSDGGSIATPETVAPTTTVASTTAAPTTLAPTTTAAPTTTVAATTTVAPTTTVAATTTVPAPVVPNLVGKTTAEAQLEAAEAGFGVLVSESIPLYAVGLQPELAFADCGGPDPIVGQQDPAFGAEIETRGTITVYPLEGDCSLLAWVDTGMRLSGTWTGYLGEECVMDLAVDPEGTPWAACVDGLWQFDGDAWLRAAPGSPPGINSIAFDASGVLIAAAPWSDSEAVWAYEDGAWSLSLDELTFNVASAPDGSVWAAARFGQIHRFSDGTWELQAEIEGHELAFGPDGTLWAVGPETGLQRWADGVRSDVAAGRGTEDVWAAPDGSIWLDCDGVCHFTGTLAEPQLVGANITDMAFAPDGSVWAVSSFAGAFRFDGSGWVRYTVDDGLASNALNTVIVTADGAVWFSSADNGVSRFEV